MHSFYKSLCFTSMVLGLLAATHAANGQSVPPARTSPKLAHTAAPKFRAVPSGESPDAIQQQILLELRQIHALLEKGQRTEAAQRAAAPAPSAPERARVSTAGFELGSKNAPITIVEFADYQCPFCRQFHNGVFAQIKKEYIDTGKVRFVSRDLPLDFHPNAHGAALAARCAGAQDKYWPMHDALIEHADKLGAESLTAYATTIGVDLPRFKSCLQDKTYSPSIDQDLADATAAGIAGTPSFVIGRSSSGPSVDGEKLVGAQPYETFAKILTNLMENRN